MAIKKSMSMISTSAFFVRPINFLLLLLPGTDARYLSGGAYETQAGMMATDGISPVPTRAPSLEVQKRAIQTLIYPPPPNWCGFVDGDYQNILSCPTSTSCLLRSNFYNVCDCTNLNTDLCFDNLPTTCVDYDVHKTATRVGRLTGFCDNSHMPYCQTFTAPGLSPAFGCAGTSLPRTHSLMPVAEYYSALVTTPSTSGTNTCTNTGPATTPTTTTNYPSYFSTKHHRRSSASEVAAFALGVAFALLGSVVCLGIFLARQPGYYILAPPTGSHEYCSKQTNRS